MRTYNVLRSKSNEHFCVRVGQLAAVSKRRFLQNHSIILWYFAS